MQNKYFLSRTQTLILLPALLSIAFASCKLTGSPGNEIPITSHSVITGAGSSFANPIYSKMLSEFCTQTGIPTSYQAIGSSAGIKRLMSKSVDFGASDAFLSNDDMSMFTASVVEFPTCVGAVVITYNLDGDSTLRLTSDVLADIYLGKITNWSDTRIKAENKSIQLPDEKITVVHRADGSGTSYVFTDYLSKANNNWRTSIGTAKLPNWTTGIEGDGNEGVASIVKKTPGAIGYIELTYALQKKMNYALIKNPAGNYIKATLESVSASANVDIPADTRISITNSGVPDAYPISSFTWIMLYKEQSYNDRTKLNAIDLVKELSWMINEGQQYTSTLNYAPLPPKAVAAAKNVLASVTYAGEPILRQPVQ